MASNLYDKRGLDFQQILGFLAVLVIVGGIVTSIYFLVTKKSGDGIDMEEIIQKPPPVPQPIPMIPLNSSGTAPINVDFKPTVEINSTALNNEAKYIRAIVELYRMFIVDYYSILTSPDATNIGRQPDPVFSYSDFVTILGGKLKEASIIDKDMTAKEIANTFIDRYRTLMNVLSAMMTRVNILYQILKVKDDALLIVRYSTIVAEIEKYVTTQMNSVYFSYKFVNVYNKYTSSLVSINNIFRDTIREVENKTGKQAELLSTFRHLTF